MNRRNFLVMIGGAAILPLLPKDRKKVCPCGEDFPALQTHYGKTVCFECATADEMNSVLYLKGLRDTP
jgi:hypothetical protein